MAAAYSSEVGHGLRADLVGFSFRTGDHNSRAEFIDRELVHDGEQLLLDEFRDIVFDRDVQSAFMPQLSDTALQREQDSLYRFFKRNDRNRSVQLLLELRLLERIEKGDEFVEKMIVGRE